MMTAGELRRWLDTIDPEETIAVDDGGLTLVLVSDENVYMEVGGLPDDEDDDDE
jgi:hypothetical protein